MLVPNVREKIFAISVIFTILAFLFNILILIIENNLNREEEELKASFELDVDNQELKARLEKINLQKEKYFNLVELWYLITTVALVLCFAYLLIVPIYRTVSTIP